MLTPPEVARRWGIAPDKVLHLIHTGQLVAVNLAPSRTRHPRWRPVCILRKLSDSSKHSSRAPGAQTETTAASDHDGNAGVFLVAKVVNRLPKPSPNGKPTRKAGPAHVVNRLKTAKTVPYPGAGVGHHRGDSADVAATWIGGRARRGGAVVSGGNVSPVGLAAAPSSSRACRVPGRANFPASGPDVPDGCGHRSNVVDPERACTTWNRVRCRTSSSSRASASIAHDDQAADASAPLRQLISEGRIVKRITVKEGNQFQTKTIEQTGPVAYVETTTSNSIFKEDLNRCLLVTTDDSIEQTKEVLRTTARRYSASSTVGVEKVVVVDRQTIIDRHREFQASLEKFPRRDSLRRQPGGEDARRSDRSAHAPSCKCLARSKRSQILAPAPAREIRKAGSKPRPPTTKPRHGCSCGRSVSPLIGFSDAGQKTYDALRQQFKSEFTTTQAEKAGGFAGKMACHRALKELVAMNVLQCVAPGKSHGRPGGSGPGCVPTKWSCPPLGSVFSNFVTLRIEVACYEVCSGKHGETSFVTS